MAAAAVFCTAQGKIFCFFSEKNERSAINSSVCVHVVCQKEKKRKKGREHEGKIAAAAAH